MEPGAILTSQLPLHAEYPLSSDHDCLEQFSNNSLPSAYATGGAFELRRDGALQPSTSHSFFTATNNTRLHPEGALAPDGHRYKAGNHFTDSSTGSISSPSSAASSLVAYNNYSQGHYTSLPTFPGAVQPTYLPSSHAGTRYPPISDCVTPGILPPPIGFRTASDREPYAHFNPSLTRTQLSSSGHPSFVDISRSPLPGPAVALSSLGYQQMASSTSQNYNGSHNDSAQFPWPNLEVLLELTCEGQGVTPEIHAKVEKGFFLSTVDGKWTCYRRNYFSVACNFELHPNVNNGRMFLKRNNASSNAQEQVQSMGMRLSAAVDSSGGKSIELVQHTPKRDNGPKNKIEVVKVSPTPPSGRGDHTISAHGIYQVPLSTFHAAGAVPGPYLPLQNSVEGDRSSTSSSQSSQLSPSFPYSNGTSHLPSPGQSTSHTFERVQFKQATANNGKRRASQQYFHLIVELFADVRKDGSDTPVWVKVAQRISEKIVVRGRSPSHYQNEGQNGQAARGGGGNGNSYHGIGGGTYGNLNAGGFRSAGGFGSGLGGSGGYRTNHYGYNGSSGDSASSPESVEGGAADSDHHMDSIMSDNDRTSIQDYEGYQYYPSTIYEGIGPQLPVPKIESDLRSATEPRRYGFAMKSEYSDAVPGPQWQMGGCGRFQGVDSSRGYFPDLSAGTPGYS